MVRGDVVGDAKAGHPTAKEGVGDGLGAGALQRESFQPALRGVHHHEEVVEALLGPWEGAHQVQVDVGEPPAWLGWASNEQWLEAGGSPWPAGRTGSP